MVDTTPDSESEKGSEVDSLKPLDLSELQNLSFGTEWSVSTSSSKDKSKKSSGRKDSDRPHRRNPKTISKSKTNTGDRDNKSTRRRVPGKPLTERSENRKQIKRVESRGTNFKSRTSAPYRPNFEVNFYPEDEPFTKLIKVIRSSYRTYELFYIANLILEKPERFVAVVKPKDESKKLYLSVSDEMPFETEDEAIAHVFNNQLEAYFDVETVDVDPPKGNFLVVNRCTVTGELLGPPNYHRYKKIVQEHFANRLPNIPQDRIASKIESVKDEELINEWIQKMTKQKRYTLKDQEPGNEPIVFDNTESTRHYLLTNLKGKLVAEVNSARIPGSAIEKLPSSSHIRRSIEHELEYQRKFPLTTANHLRGRLRRQKFAVYKKGAKGISYICAIKRKFREPGQVFAKSIQDLIDYIEKNPDVLSTDLAKRYLGIDPETKQRVAPTDSADIAKETPAATTETPIETTKEAETPKSEESIQEKPEATQLEAVKADPEVEKELVSLMHDLRWLIREGYVTEFGDGRLQSTAQAEKKPESAEKKEDSKNVESTESQESPSTSATNEKQQDPGGLKESPSEPVQAATNKDESKTDLEEKRTTPSEQNEQPESVATTQRESTLESAPKAETLSEEETPTEKSIASPEEPKASPPPSDLEDKTGLEATESTEAGKDTSNEPQTTDSEASLSTTAPSAPTTTIQNDPISQETTISGESRSNQATSV